MKRAIVHTAFVSPGRMLPSIRELIEAPRSGTRIVSGARCAADPAPTASCARAGSLARCSSSAAVPEASAGRTDRRLSSVLCPWDARVEVAFPGSQSRGCGNPRLPGMESLDESMTVRARHALGRGSGQPQLGWASTRSPRGHWRQEGRKRRFFTGSKDSRSGKVATSNTATARLHKLPCHPPPLLSARAAPCSSSTAPWYNASRGD